MYVSFYNEGTLDSICGITSLFSDIGGEGWNEGLLCGWLCGG
jgi:hypothetical protein